MTMSFSVRLDTSHHGPPHPYKDSSQASTVRWWNVSSLSTGAAYRRDLGVPTGRNPEDSSQASVEATQWVLLYLSLGHDRTPRTAQLKCAGAPSCMYSTLSAVTHKLNASGHVLVWAIFSCFGMWNSCLNFVRTFQLHHVYKELKSQMRILKITDHEVPQKWIVGS
jgi:hypothetical protein